ncbi:hypothetical protein R1sor_004756 [Riccia sorocarpa]|uniref:F-box domain-containing protein n=1 Tax=Riccia sorocarpa TaxID=122646 RepID=A0ABD3HLD2_9MARC
MESAPPDKVQSGTISYSTPTLEDVLIPSLWQQLPLELLQRVLTKLPLSSLRKFSRVSKQWKSLFRSEEFARACDSEEPTVYYLDGQKPESSHKEVQAVGSSI